MSKSFEMFRGSNNLIDLSHCCGLCCCSIPGAGNDRGQVWICRERIDRRALALDTSCCGVTGRNRLILSRYRDSRYR